MPQQLRVLDLCKRISSGPRTYVGQLTTTYNSSSRASKISSGSHVHIYACAVTDHTNTFKNNKQQMQREVTNS